MSLPFRLDEEVALITGGGRGIGRAIAECMAAAGARVVVVGRNESALAQTCEQLGAKASYLVQDITRFDAAEELLQKASQQAGAPVTILVNNAGNHLKKAACETTIEDFETILRTHLLAAHALTRAVLPGMIQQRRGNILFIASMASFLGVPGVVAYAAAKSAYLGVVRTLAAEVSEHGVRVNAIAPGWIETEMSRKAMEGDPARKEKILGRTPMKCFGQAEDVGWAAVYLCSPAARFVTGTVLPVDGGASIGF